VCYRRTLAELKFCRTATEEPLEMIRKRKQEPEVLSRDMRSFPPLAGGEPELGESLCSDLKFMDAPASTTANELVTAWRRMSRDDFEDSANRL
jgi:hypothetical protein